MCSRLLATTILAAVPLYVLLNTVPAMASCTWPGGNVQNTTITCVSGLIQDNFVASNYDYTLNILDGATLRPAFDNSYIFSARDMKLNIGNNVTIDGGNTGILYANTFTDAKIGNDVTITSTFPHTTVIGSYDNMTMSMGDRVTLNGAKNAIHAGALLNLNIGDNFSVSSSEKAIYANRNVTLNLGDNAKISGGTHGVSSASSIILKAGDNLKINGGAYAFSTTGQNQSINVTAGKGASIRGNQNAFYSYNQNATLNLDIDVGEISSISGPAIYGFHTINMARPTNIISDNNLAIQGTPGNDAYDL